MKSQRQAVDQAPELGPVSTSKTPNKLSAGPLREADLIQDNFQEQIIDQSDLQGTLALSHCHGTAVAMMYDDLLNLVPNRTPQESNRMVTAFDKHLQLVMGVRSECCMY